MYSGVAGSAAASTVWLSVHTGAPPGPAHCWNSAAPEALAQAPGARPESVQGRKYLRGVPVGFRSGGALGRRSRRLGQ